MAEEDKETPIPRTSSTHLVWYCQNLTFITVLSFIYTVKSLNMLTQTPWKLQKLSDISKLAYLENKWLRLPNHFTISMVFKISSSKYWGSAV